MKTTTEQKTITSILAIAKQRNANQITSCIKRYHIKKGFPKGISLPYKSYLLNYSTHAKREAKFDSNSPDDFHLPLWINFSEVEIFEIEIESQKIKKIGCRLNYNNILDLILIINVSDYTVKTVWFNLKSDEHKNVDLTKYNNPK